MTEVLRLSRWWRGVSYSYQSLQKGLFKIKICLWYIADRTHRYALANTLTRLMSLYSVIAYLSWSNCLSQLIKVDQIWPYLCGHKRWRIKIKVINHGDLQTGKTVKTEHTSLWYWVSQKQKKVLLLFLLDLHEYNSIKGHCIPVAADKRNMESKENLITLSQKASFFFIITFNFFLKYIFTKLSIFHIILFQFFILWIMESCYLII